MDSSLDADTGRERAKANDGADGGICAENKDDPEGGGVYATGYSRQINASAAENHPDAVSPVSTDGTDKTDAAAVKRDELEFWMAADIIYNRARASWLTRCHQAFLLLTIVAGSTAATDIVNAHICAFAVVLFATLDLVLDPATMAAAHREIVRALHGEVIKLKGEAPSVERLRRIERRLLKISTTEGAPYNALRALAHNATIRALGRNEAGIVEVSRYRRLTSNLFRFEGW